MSDAGWLVVFALISVLLVAVSGWMAWYSRRATREHKDQMKAMIREMRDVIDLDGDEDSDSE